jgi:Ni/Co efflux regulator RcnB
MLRAFVIAATIALVAPGVALAQEHHDEHHEGGPPHPGGPPPHPMPHPGGPVPGVAPHGPPPGAMGGPHPPGPPAAMVRPAGPPMEHMERQMGPPPGAAARFNYRGREVERVHVRPFFYPPGYGYRRWEVGAELPPDFLVQDYWYADWDALGLEPPPPGYQWVRYGPDLLLVNLNTGQVADVAYDVFYD